MVAKENELHEARAEIHELNQVILNFLTKRKP